MSFEETDPREDAYESDMAEWEGTHTECFYCGRTLYRQGGTRYESQMYGAGYCWDCYPNPTEEELAEEASTRIELPDWYAEQAFRNWCFLLTVRIGLERWKWRAVHKCWSPPATVLDTYRSSANGKETHAPPPNVKERGASRGRECNRGTFDATPCL
jgi:hypothetical protein